MTLLCISIVTLYRQFHKNVTFRGLVIERRAESEVAVDKEEYSDKVMYKNVNPEKEEVESGEETEGKTEGENKEETEGKTKEGTEEETAEETEEENKEETEEETDGEAKEETEM